MMHHRPLIRNGLLSAAALLAAGISIARSADAPASQPAPVPADTPLQEIDVRDASLRDALTLIGAPAGLNLAASDEAAKTRVTLHLHNITPYGAVQAICQTNGLFFKKPSPDEIGIVTTVKEFQDGITIFREEKTKIYTLLYPNAVDLAAAIRDLFGTRVRVSLGANGGNDADQIQRALAKFDMIDSRSDQLSLGLSLNSGGSGGGGGGGNNNNNGGGGGGGGRSGSSSGATTIGGNNVFNLTPDGGTLDTGTQQNNGVGDLTPQQIQRLSNLLKQNQTGVDSDALAGLGRNNNSLIHVSVVTRNNQVIVRTSDPSVLEEIDQLKSQIDIPTPQVLLEMKVLQVDLSDGFLSMFDMQYGDQHNTAGFSTGDILPPPSANAPALTIGGTGAAAGSPFALNPSALIYQYVNDNFRLRMQLLDNTNRVTTLATPMLLVANNEVSRIFIGQERPIVTSIGSQTSQNQTQSLTNANTTFNFQPVGTTLLITPNINADRTVTLRLTQETSSVITGGATIPVLGNNGVVNNTPVDVVAAQTLTGTLVAKDGLSLAMGGLIEEGLQDTREEVPVLGKLPIIGVMFRRQSTGRYRRETIVVIRPFILSTPSEAESVGKKFTDSHSLHPLAPNLNPASDQPIGTMNTYLPHEVLRPNPPQNQLETIFQFHSVLPTDF